MVISNGEYDVPLGRPRLRHIKARECYAAENVRFKDLKTFFNTFPSYHPSSSILNGLLVCERWLSKSSLWLSRRRAKIPKFYSRTNNRHNLNAKLSPVFVEPFPFSSSVETYCTYKRELYTSAEVTRRHTLFLFHISEKSTLFTDHKPLTWLFFFFNLRRDGS